ncbi:MULTISPECIES: RraA family protein [unclassified Roseitalea]|uniref:RraA family protein n=1 Tax=unclassified Roseitalea TaxID=2639107 RepID=UPI00273F2F8B|nr:MULTISPECIES: RraA family protein [unclassified Roseitalea]
MRFNLRAMPPPLPSALIERAVNVETATLGHMSFIGFPDGAIAAISPMRTAGTAVTLALPGPDSAVLHHACGFVRAGDVVVIDRLGDRRHACVGGGVARALKQRGCAGVVIDGPATDLDEIRAEGLGVWCRGTAATTTTALAFGGYLNVDICCGGAVVHPGDLIIADMSGVAVVPAAESAQTVAQALERQDRADATMIALSEGRALGELSGATARLRAMPAPAPAPTVMPAEASNSGRGPRQ